MEPPRAPLELAPGKVIADRYRIVDVIGYGGMGTVFLAEHIMIRRRVAVKILHKDLSHDALMVKRFLNEARAAGTLGHPNIVESIDMGVTSEHLLYIVFEYIDGTLLADEIYRESGGLPIQRALAIADQIASAFVAAHAAGIVHRDLKSDNIFVTTTEESADHVTVIDFGVSRFQQATDQRTGRGQGLVGTLEFMAPEQITNPEAVDHRADIYALGVVLYEMLGARLPFQLPGTAAPTKTQQRIDLDAAHALLLEIVSTPPPPLQRRDAPPGLREMIEEKLLAKDPAKRYQTMEEVRAVLAAFLGVMQVTAPIADAEGMLERLATRGAISKSLLDPGFLTQQLAILGSRWSVSTEGLRLELRATMSRCADAIIAIATLGDDLVHYPRIALDAHHMILTTYTEEANAITKLDLIYAARLERWLRENGF